MPSVCLVTRLLHSLPGPRPLLGGPAESEVLRPTPALQHPRRVEQVRGVGAGAGRGIAKSAHNAVQEKVPPTAFRRRDRLPSQAQRWGDRGKQDKAGERERQREERVRYTVERKADTES